jgi:hypothetical protein
MSYTLSISLSLGHDLPPFHLVCGRLQFYLVVLVDVLQSRVRVKTGTSGKGGKSTGDGSSRSHPLRSFGSRVFLVWSDLQPYPVRQVGLGLRYVSSDPGNPVYPRRSVFITRVKREVKSVVYDKTEKSF